MKKSTTQSTVTWALAFVLGLGLSSHAQAQANRIPNVRSVEMSVVTLKTPMRVGFGDGAKTYEKVLEVRLEVAPYLETGIEPFLYIGEREIRGHDIVRHKDGMTKIFRVPNYEDLQEDAPIVLSVDHGRPLTDKAARDAARFRYSKKKVNWEGASVVPPEAFEDTKVHFVDARGRRTEVLEPGDPFSIEFTGMPPGAAIQAYILDETDQEWSYARLFADRKGRIEPTLLWYHNGVVGAQSPDIEWVPEPAFESFQEARKHFAQNPARLELRTLDNKVFRKMRLPLAKERITPMLFPSNADGQLSNSFRVNRDDVFVTGTNFPAGATVGLFVVNNQYDWHDGDIFSDAREGRDERHYQIVRLDDNQTQFTVNAWTANEGRVGSYDLVARILDDGGIDDLGKHFELRENDIVSYGEDTGFLLYLIINGNVVIESAGRTRSAPAKFEFSDSFERHESVFAAVDPTDVPAAHTGGNYAAYYVVDHQPASYWDAPSPALVDVSGGTEIKRVKYWCINVSRTKVWNDPDPSGPVGEYDVVVDFGSTPAMTAADYTADNTYNKGIDFIDGYNRVGFYVAEDPTTPGSFLIGNGDHYDDIFNTPSDPNDPFNLTSTGFPLVRNWFTIRYPGASAGTGVSLPAGTTRYPLVLFLHGRHAICSGLGPTMAMSIPCSGGTRIPNHQGYNYILDTLASRGFIAISIDAYDIQPSNGVGNYEARGRLILEHLNRIQDWDINGTDPFGGIFQNRIDMTQIGIAGHSRGGEGVVAATEINSAEPATYGHSIGAAVAIAPTDQQSGTSWDIETSPYLLLASAADGDVWNQQGFRTYDRAYPTGASVQHPKAVAWIHGANHNYFNTIWTPSPPLATPHGFDFASDDGSSVTGPRLTDVEQRQIGATTMIGFFEQHLKGVVAYREIFTGRLEIASMRNDMIHWGYQDADRLTVDDFEQSPHNINSNSLGGAVTLSPGFSAALEEFLNPSLGNQFYHQTWGVRLGWNASKSYESNLPAANQNVSAYTHLSFRVTQIDDSGSLNPIGNPKNLKVNLRDTDGDSALWDLDTNDFTDIPYPYRRTATSTQWQMKTVRIPLQNFTMNNSGVDLDKIEKIIINFQSTGLVGIDDVQFTN